MTNLELLRTVYSDFAAVPANLHPEFKLYAPGSSPVAGVFDGLEGLQAHLGEMQQLSGGSMKLNAHTFMADGEWGMAVSHIAAERSGDRIDMQGFGLWRFKDGKLLAHWEAVSDPAGWDAFWS